ncbi:hypothetical protein [Streptomyces sp. NPDC055109]
MEKILRSVWTDLVCEVVEFNSEDNQVHLLVNLPPMAAVTKPVNPSRVSPPAACARSFPTWYGTTGGPTNCGPAPPSPKPPAAPTHRG